jgi:hypothetical protein
MKKKTLIPFALSVLLLMGVSAQSPDAFRYQSIVRNDDGTVLAEHTVSFRFKIRRTAIDGEVIFSESHPAVTTSKTGSISLQIGRGTHEHASLAEINWADNSYFLEIEIDKGAGYVAVASQQLLSVPYAKHAESARNVRIRSANGKLWNILIDNNGAISTQEVTP